MHTSLHDVTLAVKALDQISFKKTTIHQVLYLLDRFGISDEFYHEIAMIFPSLPWSHHVKDFR